MDEIQTFKELLANASKTVVFTGAGISTGSGISDYRSQGGLWQRFQPVTIQEFMEDEEKRVLYWERKKETYQQLRGAKPNDGHLALARLEQQGKLHRLITQNIDGLHQDAGNTNVIEIHGTGRVVICLDCDFKEDSEATFQRVLSGIKIPVCPKCGGLLKPNTISFGQNLDQDVLREAFTVASECDLMIAIGSTLVVEPAASIPRHAKDNGARLIILNRDSTPLDFMADLCSQADISETLSKVIEG